MSLATVTFDTDIEATIIEEYRRQTPRSREYWDQLRAVTPAGYLSTLGILPYPMFVADVIGSSPDPPSADNDRPQIKVCPPAVSHYLRDQASGGVCMAGQ